MHKSGYHVIPKGPIWGVLRAGATRFTGRLPTRIEAIVAARAMAINDSSALYIHGEDGRILIDNPPRARKD